MKYKALVSFAGKISMGKGEERVIKDKKIADDLLRANYIEKMEKTPKKKDDK